MVQTFVSACVRAGMTTVVCSPGSRNSSLVIAFDEHPKIKTYVIHDERSAAFIGMGIAMEINKPVGVLCTSGSAMLNYYPAVAEAYYQRIPLVVISADRPEKWINQGDGQTIVQKGVYTNHIEGEIHFDENSDLETVEKSTLDLFSKITLQSKGPIHFNIALEEPLYQTTEISDELPQEIDWNKQYPTLNSEEITVIKKGLELPKKMILIGQMPKNPYFLEVLKIIADDTSFAILVENTSNLSSMKWVHCIDRTLQTINSEEELDFAPDLLITFGGAIVSKRIKAYLRKHQPKAHWKIGIDFPEMNTYEALTNSFQVSEAYFLDTLIRIKSDIIPNNYGSKWKQRDFIAQERAEQFLINTPFSDLKAIEVSLDCIPEGSHIHMGNSSIVRYCQLFNPIPSMTYFSNRGTSGIDGSVSTAVGAALAQPQLLHVLIVGDISFFYDSNALWNKYRLNNLRIVVINNGGGGIFNIIKGPRTSKQNADYFEAKHSFKTEHIAKAFGVDYFSAGSEEEMMANMADFYAYDENSGIKLLEIHTQAINNHLILDEFFEAIQST
ncbi:MAG: 2-succinyl-5-enolpyruvyl-6-hydroxy-3-cyclohexene-1-carboxylic-acid synthase [Crocinitomicaceae bacterium]|nr:2-succinyl-5-enolpyruvyl-6-hydroxy-3-cyclohexene-1-carboxylic-acid synthase [Crocinitomicaceae bacterium]